MNQPNVTCRFPYEAFRQHLTHVLHHKVELHTFYKKNLLMTHARKLRVTLVTHIVHTNTVLYSLSRNLGSFLAVMVVANAEGLR